jgi:glycosyltransferase involved in cell wall biosynthesis
VVRTVARSTPRVVHLTTVDMSLTWLLLPQLIAFRAAGCEVIGVSAPGPHVPELEAHGIRHVPLRRSTRGADLRADLASAREFTSICRRLEPDIVHTHNPKPGVYGRIGARFARVPHVVNTVHGLYATTDDPWTKRAVVYGLERLAATCSDVELVQNPEDVPVLQRLQIPVEKLRLLGNGIDLTRFDPARYGKQRAAVRAELGVRPDEVLIGAVGRLVAEKGYRELFAAVETVRARHPQARFVVIGPSDPDKADALTLDELDAASRRGVQFLGVRTDVERLYPAMDAYVLASYREGFPRSAMEAAANGLPIVATDIRGCRQVVAHESTGLLVPPRDARRLADALARLVTDPSLRTRMSVAARAKAVAEFDDRRLVEMTLAVYEELLGRSLRPGVAATGTQATPPGVAAKDTNRVSM